MIKKLMKKKVLNLALALALALGILTGSAVYEDNTASAHYGYYHVYYGGMWHEVPTWCYSADWVVRYFYGYYNSRTCVMNHMGYPGIYP